MDERDDYGYGWSEAGQRLYGLRSGRRQGRNTARISLKS